MPLIFIFYPLRTADSFFRPYNARLTRQAWPSARGLERTRAEGYRRGLCASKGRDGLAWSALNRLLYGSTQVTLRVSPLTWVKNGRRVIFVITGIFDPILTSSIDFGLSPRCASNRSPPFSSFGYETLMAPDSLRWSEALGLLIRPVEGLRRLEQSTGPRLGNRDVFPPSAPLRRRTLLRIEKAPLLSSLRADASYFFDSPKDRRLVICCGC